jgi:hypothetical protein
MANKQSPTKKKWYPAPALVRKRIKEMGRAFTACFPNQELPNNGLGRKWARYMMRTKRLYPSPQDHLWLENWCPWMDQSERDRILGLSGHWYSTSSLGQHLEICNAIRKELRLWTMRPTDMEWEQVQSEMKDRKHKARQERRHANGVKVRRKGVAKPWKVLSMGRTKYYRLGLHLKTMVADVTNGTPESLVSIPYVVRTGAFRVPPCQDCGGITFTEMLDGDRYCNGCGTIRGTKAPEAIPLDTNVVPFQPRQSQATSQNVAGSNNMLAWRPMRTDPCNGICADTNGRGRFVIRTGDFIVLKHNGEELRKFSSRDEAMAYAQDAYASLLRADDDFQMMPDMMLEAA